MSLFNFLKIAIKDYRTVGAMAPGSRYFSRRVAKTISPDAKLVVEIGPGSGVITKEILRVLPREGRLIVIELKDDFITALHKIQDPRLSIIRGNAFEILSEPERFGLINVDGIIWGIPFLVFSSQTKDDLVAKTHKILKHGGTFSFYQNLPLLNQQLKNCFKKISWQFEPRNIMPYFIFTAQK